MHEVVLSFISKFADMKDHYLYGKCYWFAVILCERFKSGRKYYHSVDNHWAVMINGRLYDASGEINKEGFSFWPGEFVLDDLHYNRLVKQCIEFTE